MYEVWWLICEVWWLICGCVGMWAVLAVAFVKGGVGRRRRAAAVLFVLSALVLVAGAAGVLPGLGGKARGGAAPSGYGPAEFAYTVEVAAQLEALEAASDRLGVLLLDPRVFDPAWVIDAVGSLEEIADVAARGRAMAVPPLFAGVHMHYLAALDEWDAAAGKITCGLDRLDRSLLGEATQHIQKAGFHFAAADEALRDVVRSVSR